MFDLIANMIAQQPMVCLFFLPVVISVFVTIYELSPTREFDTDE